MNLVQTMTGRLYSYLFQNFLPTSPVSFQKSPNNTVEVRGTQLRERKTVQSVQLLSPKSRKSRRGIYSTFAINPLFLSTILDSYSERWRALCAHAYQDGIHERTISLGFLPFYSTNCYWWTNLILYIDWLFCMDFWNHRVGMVFWQVFLISMHFKLLFLWGKDAFIYK